MKKIVLTLLLSLSTFLQAEEIPSFELTTITDKNITVNQLNISKTETGIEFKEFKGKAVLLVLFGHRCPPCLKEIPEFIELTKEHPTDLEIVGIEAQAYPEDKLKEFVKEHEMNYNVVAGADHYEFVSYVASMAGYTRGVPLPLLIAVNKNGQVLQVHPGLMHKDELETLIKELNE